MKVLVSNYDPLKDRIRHTFIVDIEFVALEYPIKRFIMKFTPVYLNLKLKYP